MCKKDSNVYIKTGMLLYGQLGSTQAASSIHATLAINYASETQPSQLIPSRLMTPHRFSNAPQS